MKPLYHVAKMLGIAPFTVRISGATNEEIVDIKFTSNICGFTASAIIVIVLLTGFVFATFLPQFSLRKDPVEVLTYAVSVPLNFVGSLVLVIMNSTVNRPKLEKLVKKLTSIDKCLALLRSEHSYQRDGRNIQLFMPILFLAVLLLSCDVFMSFDKLNPVFCIIERSCQIITVVALMQYCKMALMIRDRLSVMYEILSWTFCKRVCKRLFHTNCDKFGAGALNTTCNVCTQTYNTMHSPRFDMFDDSRAFDGIKTDLKPSRFIEVDTLLKLRRIYYRLYECVRIINFMYGLPVLIYIFRSATGLISGLYDIGTFFDVHTEINYILSVIIWTSILLGPIVCLTVICDMAASKTKDIAHKLQALLLKDALSSEVVEHLKLFCQQMSKDNIVFTAAGLFVVDLSFLCTYLTSITTYIVVLIQFKLH
jgi:hypothetical protein